MTIDELATEPNESGTGRWGRAGCSAAILGMAAVVCVLGFGISSWLNAGKPQPAALLSPSQVDQLHLSGTWRNADGATLTFSYRPMMSGTEQGTVEVAHLPNDFAYHEGFPPPSGEGYWNPGSIAGSPESIVVFIPPTQADIASVRIALLPAGSAASPTLNCNAALSFGECVFVKQN